MFRMSHPTKMFRSRYAGRECETWYLGWHIRIGASKGVEMVLQSRRRWFRNAAKITEILSIAGSVGVLSLATFAWSKDLTPHYVQQVVHHDYDSPHELSRKELQHIAWLELGASRNEFRCLVKLWHKESSWRWRAVNKETGATGIPQALPATKMASVGADYLTNPVTQIKWGVKYIKVRYGTACHAYHHWQRKNWY